MNDGESIARETTYRQRSELLAVNEGPTMPFLSVLCPICGSENEIDAQCDRFFCCLCGKQALTQAAIAFANSASKMTVDNKAPIIASDEDAVRALKRARFLLEDDQVDKALLYCESILDYDPECALAYVTRLLASLRLRTLDDLASCQVDFTANRDFKRARQYASPELVSTLDAAQEQYLTHRESLKKAAYDKGVLLLASASTPQDYHYAAIAFNDAGDYADARSLVLKARSSANDLESAEESRKAETYKLANRMKLGVAPGGLEKAAELFDSLGAWEDSAEQAKACRSLLHDDRNFIDKYF